MDKVSASLTISLGCVGCQYREDAVAAMRAGPHVQSSSQLMDMELVPEPDNPHDAKAIAVVFTEYDAKHTKAKATHTVGYIGKDDLPRAHKFLEAVEEVREATPQEDITITWWLQDTMHYNKAGGVEQLKWFKFRIEVLGLVYE